MTNYKVNICSINAAARTQASVSEGIRSAVERQFSFLSSMGYGFRDRQVLIKPNMMGSNCLRSITTSNEMVLQSVLALKDRGAGRIIVGDGAFAACPDTMDVFSKRGYVEKIGGLAELCDFNGRIARTKIENTSGLSSNSAFLIPAVLLDTDLIINMPVMKTHFASTVSLSLKNLMGLLPPAQKRGFHLAGVAPSVADLYLSLLDLFRSSGKQYCTIIDGLVAMEGEGPGAGSDVELGLNVCSDNGLAADLFVTKEIMGIDPSTAEHLRLARTGSAGACGTEVSGDTVFSPHKFALPSSQLTKFIQGPAARVYIERACCSCVGTLQMIEKARGNPIITDDNGLALFAGPQADGQTAASGSVIFGNCAIRSLSPKTHKDGCAIIAGCPPTMLESAGQIRFLEIQNRTHQILAEVDDMRSQIKRLYIGRASLIDTERLRKERIARADNAFNIFNEASRMLVELAKMSALQETSALKAMLENIRLRALRYNRESPGFYGSQDISVFPISSSRNFLRDNIEHMYFLFFHSLPTSFDMFCGTFTETPQGYRQELHLHLASEELTLVLNGTSDCVWFRELDNSGSKSYEEAGRITAGKFQAFRIPTRVVHTVHNPASPNDNITIKLSMFVEDRLSEKEVPPFYDCQKELRPVNIDNGHQETTGWGRTIRFHHGFRNIKYAYRIDIVDPGASFEVDTSASEKFFFVYSGSLAVPGQGTGSDINIGQGNIVRLKKGKAYGLVNPSKEQTVLFSVEGLDHEGFLENPDSFASFPEWLRSDMQKTCKEQ